MGSPFPDIAVEKVVEGLGSEVIFEHVKFAVPFRHPSGDIQKAVYIKVWSSCDVFSSEIRLGLATA